MEYDLKYFKYIFNDQTQLYCASPPPAPRPRLIPGVIPKSLFGIFDLNPFSNFCSSSRAATTSHGFRKLVAMVYNRLPRRERPVNFLDIRIGSHPSFFYRNELKRREKIIRRRGGKLQ